MYTWRSLNDVLASLPELDVKVARERAELLALATKS